MVETLKTLDLSEYVKVKYEALDFEKWSKIFITEVIDSEKLSEALGKRSIKCIRQKILFAKERFCEIVIINLGEEYLVTASEYRKPTLKFGTEIVERHCFHNVYITTEMRFFLISKNDRHIKFLLRKFDNVLENQIIPLLDSGIENLYLSNGVSCYKKYVFTHSTVVKNLFDFLKNKAIWDTLLIANPNKYYSNLPVKVTSKGKFKALEFITNDMIPDNEEYYTKINVTNEKLTMLKIKKQAPGNIFYNTILGRFFYNKAVLPEGTVIYVKNIEENVILSFDDREKEENLCTSILIITGTKMIIHQSRNTNEGLPLCFNEKEVKLANNFLIEMLKKILYEYVEKEDYLRVKKMSLNK